MYPYVVYNYTRMMGMFILDVVMYTFQYERNSIIQRM